MTGPESKVCTKDGISSSPSLPMTYVGLQTNSTAVKVMVSESGLLSSIATSEKAVFTSATMGACAIIDQLWKQLPCLLDLQELQIRATQGLDRVTCVHFALKALGAPSLQRVDLR